MFCILVKKQKTTQWLFRKYFSLLFNVISFFKCMSALFIAILDLVSAVLVYAVYIKQVYPPLLSVLIVPRLCWLCYRFNILLKKWCTLHTNILLHLIYNKYLMCLIFPAKQLWHRDECWWGCCVWRWKDSIFFLHSGTFIRHHQC